MPNIKMPNIGKASKTKYSKTSFLHPSLSITKLFLIIMYYIVDIARGVIPNLVSNQILKERLVNRGLSSSGSYLSNEAPRSAASPKIVLRGTPPPRGTTLVRTL